MRPAQSSRAHAGCNVAYKSSDYRPNGKSRAILDRAWQHVHSIPYKATARWLFYRLLQDGLYKGKSDYTGFLQLTSRARHNDWEGWQPDTLADDTRQAHEHAAGSKDLGEWLEGLRQGVRPPVLDHWYRQDNYVEAWFEAEAMHRQFEHYTRGMTLRPFKGMPSIEYKYRTAQSLSDSAERYGLPIIVLYFGDYDAAGLTIPETSVDDIRGWCDADFDFVRVGLNKGDGERLGIPENFEKPGTYQWEALPDGAAAELITSSVEELVDTSVVGTLEAQASEAGKKLTEYLHGFIL